MADITSNKEDNSSIGSFSSTTSSLIRKSKESNTLSNLEQASATDKLRLTQMLGKIENPSVVSGLQNNSSSSTNEDDYDDADEFTVKSPLRNTKRPESQIKIEITPPNGSNESLVCTPDESIKSTESALARQAKQLSTPNQNFEFESSSNSNSSLPVGFTPMSNRRSIISDYAPSIHEVHEFNQVAMVVDSTKPQESIDEYLSTSADVSRKPSVIKITKKGTVEQFDKRATSLYEQKIEGVSQDQFRLKSPSSHSLPLHQKSKSNISNPSTLQVSSSSKNPSSSNYSGKDSQFISDNSSKGIESDNSKLKEVQLARNNSINSTDTFNFGEGDALTTKHLDPVESGYTPELNKEHEIDDLPIPSRSPNRPISGINFNIDEAVIDEDLLKYKQNEKSIDESEELRSINELIDEIDDEIASNDGDELKKSITISEVLEKKEEEVESSTHERTSSIPSLNPRPLPPPPLPEHTIIPSGSSKGFPEDDGFETEEEEVKPHEGIRHKQSKRKNKHSRKARHKSTASSLFEKNHFNHDTLVQLLQITNGTIVGQEFQNLGLETFEKQLLERLVDSLSRLTADMIIDEERHDESVKRLNKAIKALEGF